MKGTLVNRILSRAAAVAGSLAVIGGTVVAAATPAGAIPPTRSWGVSANGLTHIFPVAEATPFFTPAASSGVNVPLFITTGGILDRVSSTDAFSNVGSPKIYLGSQYNQFNATNAMSSCRIIFGVPFGDTTIQAGAITGIGIPNIPILRNPAPNTKVFLPGYTLTFNKQTVVAGIRTVTAIYVQSFLQNLSVGVSRC